MLDIKPIRDSKLLSMNKIYKTKRVIQQIYNRKIFIKDDSDHSSTPPTSPLPIENNTHSSYPLSITSNKDDKNEEEFIIDMPILRPSERGELLLRDRNKINLGMMKKKRSLSSEDVIKVNELREEIVNSIKIIRNNNNRRKTLKKKKFSIIWEKEEEENEWDDLSNCTA